MNLLQLKEHFSEERMSSYEELALQRGVSAEAAIDLYKLNILLCEELYSLICCLEVCLRNKIHDKLTETFGTEDWFSCECVKWGDRHSKDIENTVAEIKKRKHIDVVRPDQMVCGLNFGFWCHVFDNCYENCLWTAGLNKIFPHYMGRPNRKHIAQSLTQLLKIRNRIAHFEIIIKDEKELLASHNKMVEVINWFSPEIYLWFKSFNNFEKLYNNLQNNTFDE